MQIAKVLVGAAAFVVVTVAHADGFVITRSLSDGREMHLFEHTAACDGGPGAFVYRNGKETDQTCNVSVTARGATVKLPAFGERVFFPRDTLDQNTKS